MILIVGFGIIILVFIVIPSIAVIKIEEDFSKQKLDRWCYSNCIKQKRLCGINDPIYDYLEDKRLPFTQEGNFFDKSLYDNYFFYSEEEKNKLFDKYKDYHYYPDFQFCLDILNNKSKQKFDRNYGPRYYFSSRRSDEAEDMAKHLIRHGYILVRVTKYYIGNEPYYKVWLSSPLDLEDVLKEQAINNGQNYEYFFGKEDNEKEKKNKVFKFFYEKFKDFLRWY